MMFTSVVRLLTSESYSFTVKPFRLRSKTIMATAFWLSLQCLLPLRAEPLSVDKLLSLDPSYSRSESHFKQLGAEGTELKSSGSQTSLENATSRAYPDFSGTGQPSSHGGGASRNPETCPRTDIPLTPLAPLEAYYGGLTTQPTPTLWVYVPFALNADSPIMLSLLDSKGNPVYEVLQTIHHNPGVLKLSLPTTVTLEINQEYRWYFMVYCEDPLALQAPNTIEGWIKRVANPLDAGVNPNLELLPEPEQSLEQSDNYANHLIWYDALTVLGNSLIETPNDERLIQAWTSLLSSPSVQLDAISTEPLQNCCTLLDESI